MKKLYITTSLLCVLFASTIFAQTDTAPAAESAPIPHTLGAKSTNKWDTGVGAPHEPVIYFTATIMREAATHNKPKYVGMSFSFTVTDHANPSLPQTHVEFVEKMTGPATPLSKKLEINVYYEDTQLRMTKEVHGDEATDADVKPEPNVPFLYKGWKIEYGSSVGKFFVPQLVNGHFYDDASVGSIISGCLRIASAGRPYAKQQIGFGAFLENIKHDDDTSFLVEPRECVKK